MCKIKLIFFSLALFPVSLLASCNDSITSEIWELDNLSEIAGHKVTFTGNPAVVQTEIGPAIRFNGVKDKLLIDSNPIGDAKTYTVEMVFNADPAYATNKDPRFMHIMDPADPLEKRVMMELRLNQNNQVYLDGFMKTDNSNLTLIDEKLLHSSGVWNHVAITYANDTLTTWFNGRKELQGRVSFSQAILNSTGKTSLGARMNDKNYFKGMIKALRITRKKLSPDQFFYLDKLTSSPELEFAVEQQISISSTASEFIVTINDKGLISATWQLEIFDSLGRRLYRSEQQNQKFVSVLLNELGHSQGFLLVKVSNTEKVYTRKVMR